MAKGHSNSTNQHNAIKLDAGEWRVWCANCENDFIATRSDAVYCSVNCRKHASRAPQRLANCLAFLDGLSFTLANYAKQYKRNKLVFVAMVRLHKQLAAAIGMFETVE